MGCVHPTATPRPAPVRPASGGGSFSGRGGSKPSITRRLYVAMYNYNARTPTDLSFKKGDLLELLDQKNSEWWKTRHCATRREGNVPSNYLAQQRSPEAEDWFHTRKTRRECENLLLRPGHPQGTFLVRPSETEPNCFSLSIRDCDATKGIHVKHFKIRNNVDSSFYIAKRLPFASLSQMIAHYKRSADGLSCKLTRACSKDDPAPPPDPNWEVAREQVKLLRQLGKGNFGQVWAAKLYGNTDVAVKMLNSDTCTPAAFLEEANLMKVLHHDKLVQLVGVCTKSDPIYIITEMMVNGSLLDYLRNGEGQRITEDVMIDYAAQICSGMEYLEKNNFIHRDLAARNILVGENHIVKVADFGLTKVIVDDEYTASKGTKFPVKWTAPEAAMFGRFSIKSDVWSFGILLVEIVTKGKMPYPGWDNPRVLQEVERGYRIPKPTNCSDKLYTIMRKCWAAEAEERPTFESLRATFDDFSNAMAQQYKEDDD